MNRYRVIWFDDEHASLDIIREKAFLNDIDLIGFSNAKEGIEELIQNLKDYDAAIIDGLFFQNAEQSGTPTSDKALLDVAMQIEKLSYIKKLPWFILSGQVGFTKEKNRYADGFKDNVVYDKLNNENLSKLWSDIKVESEKQIETQIRFQYSRVFDVCNEKYIGQSAAFDLLEVLKGTGQVVQIIKPELYFTSLRKILEDIFIAFGKNGIIPEVFIKPTVSLNESSKFLSGTKEKNFKLNEPVFPKIISNQVRSALAICHPAAHKSDVDKFINLVNSSYFLFSVTYQLLGMILWFKIYNDSNPKIENWEFQEEKKQTLEQSFVDLVFGTVINMNQLKGFAFFKPDSNSENVFIPPQLVTSHSLHEGMPERVEIEEYQDLKIGEIKKRVKRIEI